MFEISIKTSSATLYGLDALDERRRLKLTDQTYLYSYVQDSDCVPVSEGFARAHFARSATHVRHEDVPLAWLVPGELVEGEDHILRLNLTPERVVELWLAAARAFAVCQPKTTADD